MRAPRAQNLRARRLGLSPGRAMGRNESPRLSPGLLARRLRAQRAGPCVQPRGGKNSEQPCKWYREILSGQCPVRGCFPRVEHLRLHLRTHKEVKREEREVYMSRLRYKSAITLLRELRATNPEVPMASRLDITSHSQYSCTKRECIDRLKEFEEEVASLKAEVASLKRQIEELTGGQSTSTSGPRVEGNTDAEESEIDEEHEEIPEKAAADIYEDEPSEPERSDSEEEMSPRQPERSDSEEEMSPRQPERSDSEEEMSPRQPKRSDSEEEMSPRQPERSDSEEEMSPRQPERSDSEEEMSPRQPERSDSEEEMSPRQSEGSDSEKEMSPEPDEEHEMSPELHGKEEPAEPKEPKEISRGPEEDELTMESEIRQNIQMIYQHYLAQKRGEVGSEPDVHPALEKLLKERKKGSTENFDFSKPMALYLNTYQQHIFRPEGTTKVKENCISAATRAKIFVAYLKLATPRPHWEWTFFERKLNILNIFPSVLCRVGLVPTTVVGYLQNISAFLQNFADQPPATCRMKKSEIKNIQWEIKKLQKDSGRVITAHQQVTKAKKLDRLIPKEKLQKCQQLAAQEIPKILDEMEKAPTMENKWKNLFYGYFTAYFASIYGHRTNVFTNMTQKEVANAHRNEDMGYTIDVMSHKTAQTYGVAQLFVYKHEYDWCLRWLKLLEKHPTANKYFLSSSGAGPIKDMRSYMARAWCHMALGPAPTFIDLRTAVSTYVSLDKSYPDTT
ncbi:hypothetical protein WMY93_029819 [Mugilogobius chulae]|uniref:C2H2-type domain-containing protein n=1 Tax=Mugilogobius chulae TaxID=88201 RepID=A0AAW0MMV4_9GOBI